MRVAKNAFTSGWVNRYVDVAAATPALTLAQSAGEQFGGAGGGAGGSALAVAAPPRKTAPADAKAPTASATARYPERRDGNTITVLSFIEFDWRIVPSSPGQGRSGHSGTVRGVVSQELA